VTLRIPLAKPEITDADREAVQAVLNTASLSMGPKLPEFEQAMASYVGSPFAVAVNSGTSALHLAVKVLNLTPGAEVILPSFSFSAILNVVLQERLRPVFAEIDASTLNLTPESVQQALTPRTAAIIAVHTFGRPAAMGQLCAIAGERGIPLIEDACEALGAEIGGRKAGALGNTSILAFYPNKQITTGEGGMLLTANRDLAEHARRLRNQGRDPALDWLQHAELGYSYRLSEINCALGLAQLQRLEEIVQRRQQLAAMYDAKLAGVAGIIRPPLTLNRGRVSWFCYVVQLPAGVDATGRDWIVEELLGLGIQTGRYFAPLHRQPVMGGSAQANLPVTDSVAARALALPFFNQLKESEIEEVCEALAGLLAKLER